MKRSGMTMVRELSDWEDVLDLPDAMSVRCMSPDLPSRLGTVADLRAQYRECVQRNGKYRCSWTLRAEVCREHRGNEDHVSAKLIAGDRRRTIKRGKCTVETVEVWGYLIHDNTLWLNISTKS